MSTSYSNNNKLPSNLPQLQNLIKRDPASYTEEFDRQYAVYTATKTIFEQNPTVYSAHLQELVMFLSQVARCYSERLKDFPDDLVRLLRHHRSTLNPELRLVFVKALVLLRNKNLLPPTTLLVLFFELLRCQDKVLRKFLEQHIITDIKNINSKSKNMKLNKELQNFMFEMLKDNHAIAAKTSLNVMIELYNKQIWNDAKTVNIIAIGCFSKITKIMVTAIKFFVGKDEEVEDDDNNSGSESEVDQSDLRASVLAAKVNKKNRKQEKRVEKVKSALKRNQKKKKTKLGFDFSAIHLIHDPQDMAEKLYKRLEKMNERFEVKLMTMNLISRLIGIHQLYLSNFYPLVQRFLFPHQREVTKVMVYAAQAAHALVPPDDLEPVIKTLANNFVTERYSNEVIAMGLNAIRELSARNSHCMTEDLLQDLVQYKNSKDKGVMMAARSLMALFRERNPALLARKDRGVPTEMHKETEVHDFGQIKSKSYIPGAEILSYTGRGGAISDSNSDDSDDEDGWADVSQSENIDVESEDSEDDDTESRDVTSNVGIEGSQKLTRKEAIKEVMKLTPAERADKASQVVTSRFLTDADFDKIDAAQAAKQVEKYSGSNKRKPAVDDDQPCSGEVVTLKSIEMIYKKRKHDKNARILAIQSGREGREKFGAKKGRMNPDASTTNKEKSRGKAFMMMKHKLRGKQKTSFRDKQIKLRNALLKKQKTIMK